MDTKAAIFISDIDGTLVKGETGLTYKVFKALDEFKEVGEFTLCTGRGIESASEIANVLSVKLPCILYGGAMVYDFLKDKVLFVQPLDNCINNVLRELLEKEEGLSINVYTERYSLSLRQNETLLSRGVTQDRLAPLGNLSDVKNDIIKVLLTHEDSSALERIKRQYLNPDEFECEAASRHFYEITGYCANKGRALSILCELLDYRSYHKFVAGDGTTDVTMKPLARKFYVPQTASQEVIEKADMIIPPPSESGIAIALNDATEICKGRFSVAI